MFEECLAYVKKQYTINDLTKEQISFVHDCYLLKISGENAYEMGLEYTIIWTLVTAWISNNINDYKGDLK